MLAHQAIIDVVWESHVKPLLHEKFPSATEEELSTAQAYAYGGSILQDLGYYPYANPFFSDLTHYVRSGDFIHSLVRNSHDLYDYAFALGALAHYATDTDGHHLATNRAVPILYPRLRKKFGDEVTYEDDRLSHVKTEFGFDVLQVARGYYASEDYHDFIGFEVSQPVLDAAFQETYGVELKQVLPDEDKALTSYRHTVSKLIPRATRIAWSLKSKDIRATEPGATHRKFRYNLSRSQFEKEWGRNYQKPSAGERFLAFLYKLLPKFGVLRVLELRTPTPETEKLFEASFNASVDRYRALLEQLRSDSLRLPNTNFDVGNTTAPGVYRLSDAAHAGLLDALAHGKFQNVSPELRAEILRYFSVPDAPYAMKKDSNEWARVQQELAQLKQLQLLPAPADGATRVPAAGE